MTEQIISLPSEPEDRSVVEIVDGQNKGVRYRRAGDTWDRKLYPTSDIWEPGRDTWSSIWWAVTEDGSGGTSVRVIPPDPFPLPWAADETTVLAANGKTVCQIPTSVGDLTDRMRMAVRIGFAVNAAGGQP